MSGTRGNFLLLALVAFSAGCQNPHPSQPDRPVAPIEQFSASNISTPAFAGRLYSELREETTGGSTGGDFDVDVAPDGTALVFSSTRYTTTPKIFVKKIAVGGLIQKTAGAHQDIQPKFSPDGTRIAYASDREGNFDLMIIATDENAAPWKLTSAPADEIHPTWSPDGRAIAYCARGPEGSWQLWIIDVETQKRSLLGPGLYPDWSPDGAYLAFQRPSLRAPGWHGIWIVAATGGSPREVVTEESWGSIQPAWAPNSKRLVYGTARSPIATPADPPHAEDLWVVDLDGHRFQLTDNDCEDYAPAWGLDGRIYFTTHESGSPRIVSLKPSDAFMREGM
ncbi:MAG: hypothetical protein ACKVX7_19235 [Planctomycetota bacterium]